MLGGVRGRVPVLLRVDEDGDDGGGGIIDGRLVALSSGRDIVDGGCDCDLAGSGGSCRGSGGVNVDVDVGVFGPILGIQMALEGTKAAAAAAMSFVGTNDAVVDVDVVVVVVVVGTAATSVEGPGTRP